MTALWTLAELHAAEAREDVRRIVERPYEPFRGRIAEIVLAVLDGDDELIASRLRAHEHDATAWLAYAARLLATPRTRGALEEVATSAPDEGLFWSCASMCASHRQSLHRSCYR